MIGNYYQYPNCKKKFKLTGINEMKNVYYFECGHRCTDNVFHDLIDCQAKIQNYKKNTTRFILMKQTLIEQIAIAYKKDKGKTRDHICASTNQLGAKCGKVMEASNKVKYLKFSGHNRNEILKNYTMDLIISSIKFYESL